MLADWVAIITAVSAVISALVVAFWGKEFAAAKDEIIKAKEAQNEVLRLSQNQISSSKDEIIKVKEERIASLEAEMVSLRELNPMKLREYFLSVKEQLEEYNSDLLTQLGQAQGTIKDKDLEISALKKNTTSSKVEVEKLEAERKAIESFVANLQGKLKNLRHTQSSLKQKEELLVNIGDPRVIRMANDIVSINSTDNNEVIEKTRHVLQWLEKDIDSIKVLKKTGIHLSVFNEAVKYAIRDFDYFKLGFSKFSEYTQFICSGTKFCVLFSDFEWRIAFRGVTIPNFKVLPDLEIQDRHSVKSYIGILINGKPRFPILNQIELQNFATWLVGQEINKEDYDVLLNKLNETFGHRLEKSILKSLITTTVSAECLFYEPQLNGSTEKKVTLNSSIKSADSVLEAIKNNAKKKIQTKLGEIKDEIFSQVFT